MPSREFEKLLLPIITHLPHLDSLDGVLKISPASYRLFEDKALRYSNLFFPLVILINILVLLSALLHLFGLILFQFTLNPYIT